MTLAMPDSTNVSDLPAGYDAYLGYADGEFANGAELRQRFPAAPLVLLTVTGRTLQADGVDIEPGNLNAANARVWVQKKLAADPAFRPVIYASVQGVPNYGMGDILARLNGNRISTARVRLLSAHYGWGPHICGPASCKLIDVQMDGTQWTSQSKGLNASDIDMSMLAADFFGAPAPALTETERLVTELGTVRPGDTGKAVRTVQGLCQARGMGGVKVDGVFGDITRAEVMQEQNAARITQDGIVGPQTWPVLLGVA